MASELRVDRIIPVNGVPTGGAGGVIQIVQSTYSVSTAISANTNYTDTGLTGTITPTRSDSKILIIVSQQGHVYATTTSNRWANMRILRGTTEIFECKQAIGGRGALSGDRSDVASVILQTLDSPNTTSAVTYHIEAQINDSNSANYTAQVNEGTSTMTLMEVSG